MPQVWHEIGPRRTQALRARLNPHWMSRALFAAGATMFGQACISSDAGYADVRRLTADRLNKDVRWYEHDLPAAGEQRVRELLAKPLNPDGAVQVALLNNQGLQAEFEELGIARSRLVGALQLPNPTVDADLRYRIDDSTNPAVDINALIDVTALLFLPMRGGAATAALDAARASVTGRVLDLAFETRVAFYDYQAGEQTLELRRSIVDALRASFEVAQKLHDAGNVTDLSFANERALYEEARVAYSQAEAEARARREALNASMGLWGLRGADWKAVDRLPPPGASSDVDFSQIEARAIERSLDLELGRKRSAAAAKDANFQRARGWVPELRAGVSAERELGAGGEWSIGPAVALEVPLFYQGQGETGVALAEMRQQQRAYADTAVRIRAAARAAASRLDVAGKNAGYYQDVLVPLRQRIVDETQLQFNAMSVGVFQLLQAKRDQIETARAYVEALREYWTARADVDQLLAGRLPRREASSKSTDAGSSVDPGTFERH
jgi:outer membrane protein, heavy metal efflux system